MKRYLLYILILSQAVVCSAQNYLVHSTPEAEGIHSSDVTAFLDKVMTLSAANVHGVMILRHGNIVAEAYNQPFRSNYRHTLYSCSKTFTSAAVGLCVQDSLLQLNDSVAKFFPDSIWANPEDSLMGMTIRNLLTMESGLPVNYVKLRKDSVNWTSALLGQKFMYHPGTHFAYDSMNSYLLSAIVQKVSGQKMMSLLEDRIFVPLRINKASWEESPEEISCGGWGLYLKLEDMAKFGQLLLNKGNWYGDQLLDSAWVDSMTTTQTINSSGTPYGYHMWITDIPGGSRADGAYGQYIYVLPEQDMVVAITQNFMNDGPQKPAKEEHDALVELIGKLAPTELLPANMDNMVLQDHIEKYHLPYTAGEPYSTRHLSLMKNSVSVQLAENMLGWESMRISQSRSQLKVTVFTNKGEQYAFQCGYKKWTTSKIKGEPLIYPDRKFINQMSNISSPFYISASYGWHGTDGDDLYVRMHWVNWISGARLQIHFTGNTITSVRLRPAYTNKDVIIPVISR